MVEGPPTLCDSILPTVSIVIVNWNGLVFLPECLVSLSALDYPEEKLEIILVDNASTDGSQEYIRANFTTVKVIQLDKNYGFCLPNNHGAKAARGEYVVFLNNDTQVSPIWLRELVRPVLNDLDVRSVASKILYYDRRNIINAAGGKITIIGGGFYRGYGDKDGASYAKPCYTGFGCAAGVLVRRDFFIDSGGFDEDYFAACEEHDLGWRIWLYGYKVAYAPDAVMHHRESGTFGSRSNFNPSKVYLNTRNRFYNMVKNLQAVNILRAVLIYCGFNFYRSFLMLLAGNIAAVNAVCRAHVDFLFNLNKMLCKRRYVQEKRRRSDIELYELGIIASLKDSISEERRLRRVVKY